MAKIDLRQNSKANGGIEVCYLAEDARRITSPYFKVWVPSFMGGIDKEKTDYEEQPNAKQDAQDKKPGTATPSTGGESTQTPKVKCQGYLVARSVLPYFHRLDGWIPKFHIEKMTASTGKFNKQATGSVGGNTMLGGPGPHDHGILPLTFSGSKIDGITFEDIIMTTSTGVDFQELHNTVIKRGHKMYGCFANGEQNQFIIMAIDGVTPYLDATENGQQGDNVDDHQGQFTNEEN